MGSGRDISALRTGSDSAPVVLVNSTFTERNPSLSPDGRWLLYESTQTGRLEVYVRPFPNTSEALYQVSADDGTTLKWSRDGREIFYQNASADLMRIAVTPGTTFGFTDPRVLFSLRGVADWDVMPDGQRFVVIRERSAQQRDRLDGCTTRPYRPFSGASKPTSSTPRLPLPRRPPRAHRTTRRSTSTGRPFHRRKSS